MRLPNGGTKMVHADGSFVERNRSGKVTAVTTSNGTVAKMDPRGRAMAIYDGKGTTISRGPRGERRIETTRADRSRLVSNGERGGYAERLISRGGREYAQRSYYYNGHYSSRVYAPYRYLDRPYYGYVPARYYAPAFYTWAHRPWPAPMAFRWGWYGEPWYAAYKYYFAPYPAYLGPQFWLTDYALAQSLQEEGEETASRDGEDGDSRAASAPSATIQQNQVQESSQLTSTIKDQIAEEVEQIIADEQSAAARPENSSVTAPAVPPSLDPRFPLFIVSSQRSLDADDGLCSLTAGDIVRRNDYAPDREDTLAVEVVSSKNGDCVIGTASRLRVDDLEEMHDDFRQEIDDGLQALSQGQGQSGIPSGPAADPRALPEGQSDPDLTVGDELKKQRESADQAEKDVQDVSSDDLSSH